jgi:hypothetical protein
MSFELGLLMGLGRSALKERETRAQQDKLAREQAEQQNAQSLAMLQKLVETDDLLPDEARNAAAQHLFSLATNPKAKDTDYSKAVQDTFAIANRPRPAATPQNIAANAVRTMAQPDYSFMDAIAPGLGTATNQGFQQSVPRLPEPQTVSGLLTRDERSARDEADLRRKLALQQQYAGTRFTPFADTQGLIDNEGNVVRQPNPTAPKTDLARTPFEVLIDPNSTPEQKKIAERAMTIQYTNAEDKFRPPSAGSASGMGPAVMVNTPDGGFAFVYPRLMNPTGQNMVPLPSGVTKPMTDATRNVKAQTESTIQMLDGLLNQFDTGAVDPRDAFGKGTSIGYAIRASGWVPGLAAPPEVVTAIRTDIANINNELIKLRSGAAVSASEFSRLKAELPIANMAPDEVVNRIRRMRQRLARIYELRFGARGVGDANTYPDDVEAVVGGVNSNPVSASPLSPSPTPARLPAPPPPSGFVPIGQ